MNSIQILLQTLIAYCVIVACGNTLTLAQSQIGGELCQCCRTNGTLLRWSCSPNNAGTIDLSEPLITDRPDFTEASSTVGLGIAQIEFGYTFAYDDDSQGSTRVHSWGEPLLRYGMFADWLELRVGLFPVTETRRQPGADNTTSGTEDLYLGFKIGLTPQAGIYPEMAIIPQMSVPTGSSALSNDEALPGLNWLYSWELSDAYATAGSTQFNRARDGSGQSFTEWAQSWAISTSVSDAFGAYAEWFAFFPHGAVEGKWQHYLSGGFALLVTNDVQWDIRVGMGLNNEADDFFCGTGLSIRFR